MVPSWPAVALPRSRTEFGAVGSAMPVSIMTALTFEYHLLGSKVRAGKSSKNGGVRIGSIWIDTFATFEVLTPSVAVKVKLSAPNSPTLGE